VRMRRVAIVVKTEGVDLRGGSTLATELVLPENFFHVIVLLVRLIQCLIVEL